MGIFNEKKDGIQDKKAFESAVSQLRNALNHNIGTMGELTGKLDRGSRLIKALIDGDTKDPIAKLLLKNEGESVKRGQKLIDAVAENIELKAEEVKGLYVLELRSRNTPINQAIAESGLAADLVGQIYARLYLDEGKTISETVALSKLPENQVRRGYASKLLDDQLQKTKADEILDLEPIAVQSGLSVEIVRDIRIQKLKGL
jgi:hypothetical protein